MVTTKFDNTDRKRLIRVTEQHFGVRLRKPGRRPKWLRDESGKNWWVLGGYGEWHGIPEEMMKAEVEASSEGLIVIAVRGRGSMEAFVGDLGPIVRDRTKLYRAKKTTGDYQFTCRVLGRHIVIPQIPSASLEHFASVPYDADDKEQDTRLGQMERRLQKLSPEERMRLLKSLRNDES